MTPSTPSIPERRARRAWLATALAVVAAPLVALSAPAPAQALGNGLALTPQMGFNDWNAYGCNVSESLIKSTALAMHNDGMQAAGYQYVNIDDCWMTSSRNGAGQLVPDPAKFPDGFGAGMGGRIAVERHHPSLARATQYARSAPRFSPT